MKTMLNIDIANKFVNDKKNWQNHKFYRILIDYKTKLETKIHCLVCNGINYIIAYCQTKKRQQNFDRPNLQVAQQTLTLLLLLLLLLSYFYYYYYYYFVIVIVVLYRYCFFIPVRKSKTEVHFYRKVFSCWTILLWMMPLYLKNTCEGVQFKNSERIQTKRCILKDRQNVWLASQIQYETDAFCKSWCYFK